MGKTYNANLNKKTGPESQINKYLDVQEMRNVAGQDDTKPGCYSWLFPRLVWP